MVCPALLEELREVLARAKFRRWITAAQTATFVDRLEAEAWPDPVEVPPVTADPKDDYLVALYRNADADLLVSGDSDLLELGAADVTVLTPGELLGRLCRASAASAEAPASSTVRVGPRNESDVDSSPARP